MGYLTKIKIIKRAKSEHWYVNFPAALAQAIEFQQGEEVVEWIIEDHQRLVLQRSDKSVRDLKKTASENLKDIFGTVFLQCKAAFTQSRTWKRAFELAEGLLVCMGRSTVTGMISATGQQFKDWSAIYRLFRGVRMNTERLFSVIRKNVADAISADEREIYAHMDDTLFRKSGTKVEGAKWMRDPLGSPFQTNLIWGQRFIQLSLSLCHMMDTWRT